MGRGVRINLLLLVRVFVLWVLICLFFGEFGEEIGELRINVKRINDRRLRRSLGKVVMVLLW